MYVCSEEKGVIMRKVSDLHMYDPTQMCVYSLQWYKLGLYKPWIQ